MPTWLWGWRKSVSSSDVDVAAKMTWALMDWLAHYLPYHSYPFPPKGRLHGACCKLQGRPLSTLGGLDRCLVDLCDHLQEVPWRGSSDDAWRVIFNVAHVFPKRSHCVASGSRNVLHRSDIFPYKVYGNGVSTSIIISWHLSSRVSVIPIAPLQPSFPDQVRMASSLSFTTSGFSSFSSSVPSSRAKGHPSGPIGSRSEPTSSSLGILTRSDVKAIKDVEMMKSYHDFDSTIYVEPLLLIWKHFSIPDEYTLHAPQLGQCSYHECPDRFTSSSSLTWVSAHLFPPWGGAGSVPWSVELAGGYGLDHQCAPDCDCLTGALATSTLLLAPKML
ncbi:hypothetical protein BHE74_00034051 [Ensete ventricosum]|nr:hypothetical protein BHE74_00034051 [Ensete ventricosum]